MTSRISFLTVLMFLNFCLLTSAQNLATTPSAPVQRQWIRSNLDPNANLLFHLQMEKENVINKQKKFNIFQINHRTYLPALLKINSAFRTSHFSRLEVKVNAVIGDIYSVWIPVEKFQDVASLPGIQYLELAQKTYSKLDNALTKSKVDLVHKAHNLSQRYTGKDVVIGVLDLGFDYTHPAFRDAEGNVRIQKSWEQNLNRTPPIGYSYGHDIVGAELFDELFDASDIGHGTHVTNVAAGRDNFFDGKYNGVAYDSDIVIVSLLQLAGFDGLNTGIVDGIKYVFDHAESVGKPAVINLSQGHHLGPHDGTSLVDQAIDAMSGPGRIIVGAVGNEGDESGFYLHFDHTFDDEPKIHTYLVWPEGLGAGEARVELWGETGMSFEVELRIHNPQSKVTESVSATLSTTTPNSMIDGILVDEEGDTVEYTGIIEINPLNDRPHMALFVNSTNQSINSNNLLDNDFVQLEVRAENGTVHAYSANNLGEAFFTDLSGIGADEFIDEVRVIGGNENYTIGELGGTAKSIISVGGYMVENTIVNTAGETLGTDEEIDAAYFLSSRGPTHDGRLKPDIAAPAGWIAAAANSYNNSFDPFIETDKIEKEGSGHWSYSVRRGTSISSPVVAGVVALMLEIDPSLDPDQIKEMLKELSDTDNFTGNVPNNLWGYGKLNAHKLMTALDNVTSANSPQVEGFTIVPNPSAGIITIPHMDHETFKLEVYDVNGRRMFTKLTAKPNEPINLVDLSDGVYQILVSSGAKMYREKLVINK